MSNEAERIPDIYDRHAETWDRERSRNLDERAWLDNFLSIVAPDGVVLDIGCGSAEPIGRYLMDAGHLVVGIDASPNMIAICRQHFPGGDWRVADMRALDLGQVFGGIVAWDSFFHPSREDQRQVLPLLADHAAPAAALLFTSGPTDGAATGSYHGEPLHHASLDPQEYRMLLAQNGFQVVAHATQDPHCCGHTVWLCRKINARDQ